MERRPQFFQSPRLGDDENDEDVLSDLRMVGED